MDYESRNRNNERRASRPRESGDPRAPRRPDGEQRSGRAGAERGAKRDSRAAREAERRREERKERDSLAAQEAQRRREARKERERLDRLREKQKRKAKRRSGRRIAAATWKRLLIMAGVVAAVVLSMVIFFRVRRIEANGSLYYSADEIVAAAGVAQGDNLLTISRSEVAGNIMAQLPYVKTVRVTRSLPDSLVLTVTEYDTTYAIQDTQGGYYLITADGKVTEKVEQREANAHILIDSPKIDTPTVGEHIRIGSAEDGDLTAQGQLTALTMLLTELEQADLVRQIASVSIPASYDISLQYGDRFLVKLGNEENLAYKLEYLKVVVAAQKDYTTGTIDLSFSEGSAARVTPNE